MISKAEKEYVWFESLPSTWEFEKLKFVVNLRSEKVIDATDEVYVGLENIESKTGKYLPASNQEDQDIEGISNKFYKGDVLFGKLRPYLAKCIESDFEGICTTELLVLDAIKDKLLSTYLKYLLLSPKYIDYVNSSTYGSKMPRANWEFIKNIEVPLPSISIQYKIIKFIEYKTEEIDGLINIKQNLVGLLEEKRQGMITEAVTKGLNPNVKMRESTVEWIGEIPEHWKVKPLFTVFNESKNKNKGNVITNVLSLSYGKIKRRDVESNYGLLPDSFETYQIVQPGYLILRLTDLQNDKRSLRVGLATEEGIITSAYVGLETSNKMDPRYSYFLLHSYDVSKVFYGLGSGVRQSMGYTDLKKMPLIVPPIEEQIEIARKLETINNEADNLILILKKQVAKFKEYRQSLIYEAVTGKIDVRDFELEH